MCNTEAYAYRVCRKYPNHIKFVGETVCNKKRLGLVGDAYHPVIITNKVQLKSGARVFQQVDETCPECYPNEAFAEEQRKKKKAEKEAKGLEGMPANPADYMDHFASNLS
ncbi:hypothetical protein AAE478_005202 [Parahypoxylon ruwenzoriense]